MSANQHTLSGHRCNSSTIHLFTNNACIFEQLPFSCCRPKMVYLLLKLISDIVPSMTMKLRPMEKECSLGKYASDLSLSSIRILQCLGNSYNLGFHQLFSIYKKTVLSKKINTDSFCMLEKTTEKRH